MDKLRLFLEYITMLFILLEGASVYAVSINNTGLLLMPVILIVSILSMLNISNRNSTIHLDKVVVFFIFFALNALILYINASPHAYMGFYARICTTFPLLIFYLGTIPKGKDKFSLLNCGINIMVVEAIVSMIFFFLGSCLHVIPATGTILVNWGDIHLIPNYYNIYFEGQAMRNCGIFAEAPMHNYALSTMFLAETFINPRPHKWKIWILGVAIATTTSTTGQLVLISTVCFFILFSQKYSRFAFRRRCFLVFLSIVVLIGSYMLINQIIADKKETLSYEIREDDMKTAFNVWLSHPYFGTGYASNTDGNSNSITVLLADGGLHLLCLYFYPLLWIPFRRYLRTKDKKYFFFSLVYGGMFCITNISYSAFTLLIMAFPLSRLIQRKEKLLNKNRID